jgi:hypothetical protein
MMSKATDSDKTSLWKYVAIAALSLLLGMVGQMFREPKDNVTKNELNLLLEQQKTVSLELQAKIDAQTREIIALRASVAQQSVDIAEIAAKVGATAHPSVMPRER